MNHSCPSCLKEISPTKAFCKRCAKDLFEGNEKVKPILEFDKRQFVSFKREISVAFSISGVQDKISLKRVNDRLVPTRTEGEYILKPIPTIDVPEYQEDIPANEHLTMQIARQVFKIKTAHCCHVSFKDGEPAFLCRRFDVQKGRKIAQEDFCQLLNLTEETHGENYKYDGSYEKAAMVVSRYCSAAKIEMEKYFLLILFNYAFSNGDAHLKNFSLQKTAFHDYILSPAYDLISTSVHFPNESRTALELFESFISNSFEVNGFYTGNDFLKLAERLGIKSNRAAEFVAGFSDVNDKSISLIERSYLSKTAKESYIKQYMDRTKAIRMI